MKTWYTAVLSGIAAAAVFTACAPGPAAVTPREPSELTFADDVAPIFKRSCISCHSGSTAAAQLDLATIDGVLKGAGQTTVVTPHDAPSSKLMQAIKHEGEAQPMPPSENDKLSDSEIQTIENWIANGAKP